MCIGVKQSLWKIRMIVQKTVNPSEIHNKLQPVGFGKLDMGNQNRTVFYCWKSIKVKLENIYISQFYLFYDGTKLIKISKN
jgi:hypothetical protein